MGKIDNFIAALQYYGDGRYKYYDGSAMSIGCSEYVRISLIRAGIIRDGEYFHALSGIPGPLEDKSRFQKIAWDPTKLQAGDILWCNKHHVAVWDGVNGVYEAAPLTHSGGICDNGRTGVGRWSRHTYWDCGNGTNWWSCIYRIIDIQQVKEEVKKEVVSMDKQFNMKTLISFLPTIQRGSTGSMVKMLQTIMTKYGWYSGGIDGSSGPLTVAGIKLLQTALGVSADGICGPITWTKLFT